MLKKINIPRLLWISSIFIFLIIVLHLVINYKVNYELQYKDSEKLYFYDCDGSLCTSTTKEKKKTIYSYYDCWYAKCPEYKKIIYDDYAILKEDKNISILFNYKTGTTITAGYSDYEFITNDYIIVKKGKKYGVIDINENTTIKILFFKIMRKFYGIFKYLYFLFT